MEGVFGQADDVPTLTYCCEKQMPNLHASETFFVQIPGIPKNVMMHSQA